MMVSPSIAFSETQPTDDGRPNTILPPTHLMSVPVEMLTSSDSQPGGDEEPNTPPPPPSHLMNLPEEVLVLIFSFLPLKDICNNAVRVCSRWLHIGRDYALYRTITLTDDMIPTRVCNVRHSQVFSIIQKVVKLTSFHCGSRYSDNLNVLLEAVAESCPHLQHLSVPQALLSSRVMEMFVEKCPYLCSINVCWHSPDNGLHLSKFKHLRVLKLKLNIEGMTVNVNEWFRNIVKECVSLEELYVGRAIVFDDQTLRCIVEQTKDRLKALAFTTFNYATDCIKELSPCVLLERLSLVSKTRKLDVTIDLLPLKPLRNLKCLKLKGFHSIASKDNLQELFAECTFRGLRVLTILDCPFGDDKLLQQMAASFPRLSIISLDRFTTASDAGLAELLKECPMLRSIRLERFETWTKGTCFNIHHPCLETVEIVDCNGVEASLVDALRSNSKLRVHFTEKLLLH